MPHEFTFSDYKKKKLNPNLVALNDLNIIVLCHEDLVIPSCRNSTSLAVWVMTFLVLRAVFKAKVQFQLSP